MDRPFRIFLGWDSRFPEPAQVLAHSLHQHSSIPLEIRYLNFAEIEENYGFARPPDPKASTEFTYTRFLVPFLCNFEGTALFMDNDMLCLGDIAEIAALPMDAYAIRCVQHDYRPPVGTKMYGAVQEPYPRKLWSSFMLLNCERLKLWTKATVESVSGAYLHRFQDIPDELIGHVSKDWNEIHELTPETRLFHWTEGGPWYKQYRDCPYAQRWLAARMDWLLSMDADINTPLPDVT